MKIYRDFDNIEFDENTVLTVGTFDGVHLGHQKIIHRLLEVSNSENLRPVLISFDPHPQITLQSKYKRPIFLLSTITERIELLRKYGVQNVILITFSYEFSQTPPQDFVLEYLIKKVGLKKILLGYDHSFGKNREGDIELLEELKLQFDFEVEKIEPEYLDNNIISSTKIRNSLITSNISIANNMLGHYYSVHGVVVSGNSRGRSIGFPTANIQLQDTHKLLPGKGVYVVMALINGETHYGMANIGTRPTFTDEKQMTLEVNIFNFDKDIYDSEINISFLEYLRDEQKFDNIPSLINQLNSDKLSSLEILEKMK